MRSPARSGAGIILLIAALGVAAVGATQSSQKPESSSPMAKLAGQWRLNKDAIPDETDGSTPPAPPPGTPVGPGAIGGGYPGGSSGGGGMGGRGGGYGGSGGGIGRGGYGGGALPESVLRERAIMREVSQPPDLLNITLGANSLVTFTSGDGVVRKFTANGKKEKVDLTTAEVDTITTWDKDELTQEMKSGSLTFKRTWQPTAQGSQLVVTMSTMSGARVQPMTRKIVYDKASTGTSGIIR